MIDLTGFFIQFRRASRFVLLIATTVTGGLGLHGFDLTEATIPEIHAAVDAGELTYEQLLRMHLERIAAYEGELKSIININARALFDARELDREYRERGRRSMLHGIPLALKDNIDDRMMPNTGGALALAHSVPNADAFVTARLRAAGGVLFLRNNLAEFASGAPGLNGASTLGGQPRNPYNLRHHPDGSSSGTGVALAAVFATVGLGTETGSSVRGPAMHNSIVGLAPTEGLISRHGVIPNSTTLDRIGVMGRNVIDVAVMLNFCIGVDSLGDSITHTQIDRVPDEPYESFLKGATLQGKRIGVMREVFTSSDMRTEQARALTEQAIEDLRAQGAEVIDPLASGIPEITDFLALSSLGPAEQGAAINAYLQMSVNAGSPRTLEELLRNGGIIFNKFERYRTALEVDPVQAANSPEYREHLARRQFLRERLTTLMDEDNLDAIFYLHNLYPAQMINEYYPYTKVRLSSVSGLPAIVVPAGYTDQNLPVGVEFLGRAFDEPRLLALAHAYEQATRHRVLPPATPPLATDRIERCHLQTATNTTEK